jgi:zinc finger protein
MYICWPQNRFYFRKPEQDIALGLDPTTNVFKDDKDGNLHSLMSGEKTFGGLKQSTLVEAVSPPTTETPVEAVQDDETVHLGRTEAVAIPASCPSCGQPGNTLTALTDIPHFKEVIIMAFDCKFCGFRTNEVKGGGAVPTLGTEVRLRVTNEEDLKRYSSPRLCC